MSELARVEYPGEETQLYDGSSQASPIETTAPPTPPTASEAAHTEAEDRAQARSRNAFRLVPVRHAGLDGRETVIYTNRPPRARK